MPLEIRRIQSHDEYRAVEQLQREVWALEEAEIVPDHLLLTAQKNGGLVLGAFDGDRLAGFAFGFPGLTSAGRLKHCSHMTGVAPAYQGRGLGYRLKLAQREHVLAQGLDLITWTYDPLESRNAWLNLHKLGATCQTYLSDLYGVMRDGLNTGLASDRFQVDWRIAGQHVAERLEGSWRPPKLAELQDGGAVLLNEEPAGQPWQIPNTTQPLAGPRLLIRIPADFQVLKKAGMALALGWRQHTRELFEAAFAAGYVATDFLVDGQNSFYLLEP